MEPGGRGRRGRRPDPRVAAAERVQEGSRERGAGGELNTHTRRKKGGKRGGESEQAGRQRQRTHTPAGKAKPSGKPKADREGCGAGWPRDVPRRCESWGKPGRTGDHPKSRGGPSGSRLPRSPPPPRPRPPRSRRVPSSREPRPGPGGRRRPRGEPGGCRGSARGRGPRETSAGSGGPCPAAQPGSVPRGGPGEKRAEFRQRGGGGHGRRSRRSGAGRGSSGAAGPRSFPRRLPSPACPEPPSPAGSPSPARSRHLLTKAKRGTAGGGAAGWHRGRAGRRGERRRREAPRSGWSWEDAAAAAATSPKTEGETRRLPARGGSRLRD
ncbi:collagen alpha-1(I) chain-like [Falco biarmicus]|uniref:collagen alpha-1(I) chain-like n=1 Tax=Falco biarmicus TaxID=345155 RepID=UPI0024BBFC8B|nr:collagen alpha-1(I) chain-like [Falco biarmicus]